MFLEECKHNVKEKKMLEFIIDNIETSSDSGREDSNRDNSNEENSDDGKSN